MKTFGTIWKNIENGRFLVIHKAESHVGYKTSYSLTYDIETATNIQYLPKDIRDKYEAVKVEIIKEVNIVK